jgi:REP element-mobilizing transposase RayT
MHRLRFQPDEWMYHMVTTRCIQGQALLKPLPSTNRLIAGCLAHALNRSAGAVRLHHYVFMSNHYHLILSALNQVALSSFMGHFNGCLGRELAKREGVQGHVWHKRYASHLLLDDESIEGAYRYLFANSVKEDLVEHPREWGGLHGYAQLCEGREVTGEWVDWTALYRARRRALARKTPTPEPTVDEFTRRLSLELEPPAVWADLTSDELRERCSRWADEVARDESRRRRAGGLKVLGMRRVLQEDVLKARALRPKPRPLCRASCPQRFASFVQSYRSFAALFREASSALRVEVARSLSSPIVTFPPGGVPFG